MEVREPYESDGEPVEDVVERAMTASYALSPDEIRAIVEAEFDPAATAETWDGDDVVARVAGADREDDGTSTLAGYVEADAAAEEVRWLFVHSDHRGAGVGTALFEAATDALAERGAEDPRASTREANREGGKFFEQFDYESVDECTVEFGGQSLVEYGYAPSLSEGEKSDRATSEEEMDAPVAGGSAPNHGRETDGGTWAETDFPGTERRDEGLAAVTDGETVYVDDDAPATGREAPFFPWSTRWSASSAATAGTATPPTMSTTEAICELTTTQRRVFEAAVEMDYYGATRGATDEEIGPPRRAVGRDGRRTLPEGRAQTRRACAVTGVIVIAVPVYRYDRTTACGRYRNVQ